MRHVDARRRRGVCGRNIKSWQPTSIHCTYDDDDDDDDDDNDDDDDDDNGGDDDDDDDDYYYIIVMMVVRFAVVVIKVVKLNTKSTTNSEHRANCLW